MIKLNKLLYTFIITIMISNFSSAQDWANLGKYQKENDEIGIPLPGENRIVFMGNSITESWKRLRPEFFAGKPYVNRGISGQTTPQMLLRFRQDVINLKAAAVVLLAGINDIAGNTGPASIEMIMGNIISMCELAKANNIKVVLCSVLPAFDFPWRKDMNPSGKVIKLNELIKEYAGKNDIIYADYFSFMADDRNGLKEELGLDAVHPNAEGYTIMESIIEKAIAGLKFD